MPTPIAKAPSTTPRRKKLLGEALAIQESELKLQQTYVPKLEKVLPEVKVARYIQIESKISRSGALRAGLEDSSGGVMPSPIKRPRACRDAPETKAVSRQI